MIGMYVTVLLCSFFSAICVCLRIEIGGMEWRWQESADNDNGVIFVHRTKDKLLAFAQTNFFVMYECRGNLVA